MLKQPTRTHETDLTDDELILLDGMFVLWDSFTIDNLLGENFQEVTELEYCHSLRREEVVKTVNVFASRKFVVLHPMTSGNFQISLNSAGLKAWEDEHAPDWDRYCSHLMKIDYDEDDNEEWSVTIFSPVLPLIYQFLDTALECGLLVDVQRDQVEFNHRQDEVWLGWIEFNDFYRLTFPCGPVDEDMEVDWELYETRRNWWGDLMELGGLPPE
ncbi:MAG: hypothetical protein HY862_04760 [Chloroflexi bacterium]|nr:hypothetical protein [Chloroflexota bacterium]